MLVHRDIKGLPKFCRAVITIGSFDGVHLGHRSILDTLIQTADAIGGESIVISFQPHPREVLQNERKAIRLLNTIDEKIEILENLGIDHFVLVPFTKAFSLQSPEVYIREFLVRYFNPDVVLIGFDHRFGADRRGDIEMLRKYALVHGYKVLEIPAKQLNEVKVSSSEIRKALQENQIEYANRLLGYPFLLSGRVLHGDKIGRSLGYPTANIEIDFSKKIIPADGIYAVWCSIDQIKYKAMLYIGLRPSIHQKGRRVVEVHILDFEADLYDSRIKIELLKFIRADKSFDRLEDLSLQIEEDKRRTLRYFDSLHISEKTKTAVVVLNYNGVGLLKKYLPELIRYTQDDIVLVDNSSTDDSVAYLNSLSGQIKLILLDKNYGFAEGYNRAIAQLGDYEYVVLLNSDVRVSPNWLEPLVHTLRQDKTIAAVQAKIRSDSAPEYFEYAGACGGFMDRFGYPFCRGRIFDTIEKDLGQYDDSATVHWTSGAAMLIRRALYVQFGGLDKDFFAHQEEIDLCWRLRNAGYRLMVVPSSVVYHLGGGTLSYQSTKKTYLNFRNNIIAIIKNEKPVRVLKLTMIRFVLDGLAALRFLSQGNVKAFGAVIKAWIYIVGNAVRLVRKRKACRKLVENLKIGKPVLEHFAPVLWPYFVEKKTDFNSIYSDDKKKR